MIKLVPQIFIKQSLKARPVLSAEEYSHDLDGNGCKKHNESAQRRLLPVLSSLTHGFPVEGFQIYLFSFTPFHHRAEKLVPLADERLCALETLKSSDLKRGKERVLIQLK